MFTRVTACLLAASPELHMCPKAPTASLPPPPLRIATGRSNPVAGWELHPLKTNTFARRHADLSRLARFLISPRDVPEVRTLEKKGWSRAIR